MSTSQLLDTYNIENLESRIYDCVGGRPNHCGSGPFDRGLIYVLHGPEDEEEGLPGGFAYSYWSNADNGWKRFFYVDEGGNVLFSESYWTALGPFVMAM